MMVMSERIRDLQEMESAASNRRASLRRKLELSEEVARRREQAERSAMSAEDGKELLMREFPGSTRPDPWCLLATLLGSERVPTQTPGETGVQRMLALR